MSHARFVLELLNSIMETEAHINLGRFGRFACSSLASTAVDQLVASVLFVALRRYFVGADFLRILAASVIARCVSVACNYSINRRVVFAGDDEDGVLSKRESLPRFLLLAVGVLCLSSLCVWALHVGLGMPEWQAKPLADFALFFLNYNGQRKWVFVEHGTGERAALA